MVVGPAGTVLAAYPVFVRDSYFTPSARTTDQSAGATNFQIVPFSVLPVNYPPLSIVSRVSGESNQVAANR
jgi:hypothetical protein